MGLIACCVVLVVGAVELVNMCHQQAPLPTFGSASGRSYRGVRHQFNGGVPHRAK